MEKLRNYPRTVEALELASPVRPNVELKDLLSVVDRLKRPNREGPRLDLPSVEAARRHWIDEGKDLDSLNLREIKLLCWHPETALDPAFVDCLTRHPKFKRKQVWVEGVVSAYFSSWRQMPSPEKVEALLRDVIGSYDGRGQWVLKCRDHSEELFSGRAASYLALRLRVEGTDIQGTLNEWNLSQTVGLGPAVAEAAVEDWMARFARDTPRMSDHQAVSRIEELTDRLLTFPTITNEAFGRALSEVLACDQVPSWEEAQRFLKGYILKNARLGDPRLPTNSARWNVISATGRRRFVSWLAQHDLVVFFDFVIPDRKDPHDRKAFWLQYLDYVEDSRVALCSDDEYRLRSQTSDGMDYARITGNTYVSAFLMRFRGKKEFVVVEFSKPGNAIYIYAAEKFEEVFGGLRRNEFRTNSKDGLKHDSWIARFVHKQPNEKWKRDVRDFLAKMGVRLR